MRTEPRTINWNKFQNVTSHPQVATQFERHAPNSFSRPFGFSFIYDPYVPSVSFSVALHCLTCKAVKQTTIQISKDVALPAAIQTYHCSNCLPRRKMRRSLELLTKRYPLAYGSYRAMHGRCNCKGHASFENYGGRGITICPRWQGKNGFKNFLEDMGDRTADLSIDRINVNMNYTPGNCRWATVEMQARNKRNSKMTEEEWNEMMDAENAPY